MKKIVAIGILFLCLISVGFSQGVYKMGYSSFNGALYSMSFEEVPAVMEFSDDKVKVHQWVQSEWEFLHELNWEQINLNKGTANLIESVRDRDTTYALIAGISMLDGVSARWLLVITPKGISAEKIHQADGADRVEHLTLHEGKPVVSGVFSNGPLIFNLLKREAPDQWVSIGNLLTRSLRSDYIQDIVGWNGQLYASGSFTIVGKTYHLAFLDNGTWKAVDYPPFIDESLTFGFYQNRLILFGRDRGHNDLVQFFDGIQWTGMSEGLENVVINQLDKFAFEGEDLYAVGSFSLFGEDFSLMHYNGKEWKMFLSDGLTEIQDIGTCNEGVMLTLKDDLIGDYHFRKRCIIKKGNPVLYTGFYLDKNQNCDYNPSIDDVFPQGAELLNDKGMTFLPDQDGEIAIPSDAETIELQAQLPQLFHMSCNVPSKRSISTDKGIFNAKRPVSFSESKPKADLWLRPNLSWSISAGQDALFVLCVKNSGTGVLDYAELKLQFPNRFSAFTPLDPVKFVSDSMAIWEVKQLAPMEERCYRFYLRVPQDLGIDEILQIQANLESPELEWQGSKPVEKVNLNKKSVPSGPVYKLAAQDPYLDYKPDYIDYKIVARNLSSKTVNKIAVIDTLDPQIRIDNRGIHYITSHPAKLQPSYFIDQSGSYRYVLKWVMNDLNLADSTTAPENHAAVVDFRVNLITPEENWEICNKARIIFENLEPVQTNEICNAFRDKLTISVRDKETRALFGVYPNPSDGSFSINNGSADQISIQLIDAGGRLIHSCEIPSKQVQALNIRLNPGVYYIHASNGVVRQLLIY